MDADDPYLAVLLAHVPGDPSDCPPGSHSHYDVSDPALRLFPDLRRGRVIVAGPVYRAVILIGQNGVRGFFNDAAGNRVIRARVFRGDCCGCNDDPATEGPK